MINTVILLTACVNPDGMAFTKLNDAEIRKQQYVDAIMFYLLNTSVRIVFVENTECDLSSNFQSYIHEGRLEMMNFQGNKYNRSIGKGYGEALIIKYALENSCFLKGNTIVVKITGRHKCMNINNVLAKCNDVNTLYAVLAKDSIRICCDSKIFISPVQFLRDFFLPRLNELNDSNHRYFEHLLYDTGKQWLYNGHKFKEIWFFIKIKGISGSSNIEYKINWQKRLSFYLHYILHHIGYYGTIKIW